MQTVFSPLPEEDERLQEYKARFASYSKEELLEAFKEQKRIGITGVRAQMLFILALHETFMERFGESPIGVRSAKDENS